MNSQTRLGLNIFLLTLMGLGFVTFMFKNSFSLSDVTTFLPKNMMKSTPGEVVYVPLKDILRAPVTLNQDDPSLIKLIRKKFLVPPSELPYNLATNENDPSKGQSLKIKEILNNKRNGFFIECGALDGETRSNSLVFEKEMGWKGVLIEGDPKNFELVRTKNRKAWTVPACLSTHPYPNVVMFKQQFNIGKISDVPAGSKGNRDGLAEVQCLPLYSILLALNTTTIDYFSLDVEGHELEVLKTIPWEKVNIITLSVEFIHVKDGKAALRQYMESVGYKVHSEVTYRHSMANDFIFYHPLLLKKSTNV